MSDALPSYPAYKDSGVPWLGDVPEHWELRRLGDSIHGCINGIWGNEPNGTDDLPCVRVADFDRQRLRVRLKKPTMRAIAPNERPRRLLKRGDLLLEKSGGGDLQPVGVVMLYDHEEPAVCSNFIARMPVRSGFDAGYLTYLHSHLYAIRLNTRSIKQTTGIQNLDSSAYLSEAVAFAPLPEQLAIFRYLDHVDHRIRRAIRAKQKLIALLDEQKQAIIHQAVTRGLDPNVRLKPSGVAWLGEVPEHWEMRKLGQVARVFNGTTPSRMQPSYWNGGTIPWLSSGKVNDYIVETPAELVSERALRECSISLVPKGSVIIGLIGQGKTRGKSALLAIDACINQNLAAIVTGQVLKGNFLLHILTAHYRAIREIGRGGNQEALNCSIIAGLRIPVPPLEEQAAIIKQVAEATLGIDGARDRAQREIALLREYRTRLIADVVTGKMDVRAAAQGLPDEVEEMEPLDEVEALAEAEEGIELTEEDEEAGG